MADSKLMENDTSVKKNPAQREREAFAVRHPGRYLASLSVIGTVKEDSPLDSDGKA